MASPFSVFRKHQKVLLAVLGLLAMISFVFLPIIMDRLGLRSGRLSDPVVVRTTQCGDLRESGLRMLISDRHIVLDFLRQAVQLANLPDLTPQQVDRVIGPVSERAAAETWLLARKAEQLGLVVSDRAINDFINMFTRDRVTVQQMKDILKRIRTSQGYLSQSQLFDAMRTELLARRLRSIFVVGLEAAPPGQRWDYYQRLKRWATIELVPVAVAKYLDQVPDPDEATLRKFFEQHKDNLHDPTSPDPGFRQPHRIVVEYFKAEYDKFVDPKAVTDEEIQQYYEKNKDPHYLKTSLPAADEGTPPKQQPEKKADKEAPQSKLPGPGADTPGKEQPEKKADEGVSKPKVPDRDQGAPLKEQSEKDADKEAPAAKLPGSGETGQPKTSATTAASRLALVSLEQEGRTEVKPASAEEPTAEPAKPAAESAEPASESEKAAPKPEPPAAKPEAPAPKSEAEAAKPEPAAAEPKKPGAAPGEQAGEQKGAGPQGAAQAATGREPEQSKYVPLEQVKDQIRNVLARQRTPAKIAAVLSPLRDAMNRYGNARLRYEVDVKNDPKLTPPAKLDMAALAKQNGLSLAETGMVSAWDAQNLDISRSYVDGYTNNPFIPYAFGTLQPNRPAISGDHEGNQYLFWKLSEVKEHVPALSDAGIEAEVRRAWKMLQARDLTNKEAERLAAKARQFKGSLKDVLAGEPGISVTEPKPFTWMTRGTAPDIWGAVPPRLSQVDGVDMPDGDFMRTVFGLEEGQVGTAMNHPKTVAYVVRMKQFGQSQDVLWDLFLVDHYSKYASVAFADLDHVFQSWMREIESSVGFQWQRTPDRREPEQQRGGPAPPAEEPYRGELDY